LEAIGRHPSQDDFAEWIAKMNTYQFAPSEVGLAVTRVLSNRRVVAFILIILRETMEILQFDLGIYGIHI